MTTPTTESKKFVAALFGEKTEPPAEPARKKNVVPGEGRNTAVASDTDAELRAFVADLFGRDD